MPQIKNSWGTFTIEQVWIPEDFVCAICEKKGGSSKAGEKVSKSVGEWTTPAGAKLPICNGCFGTVSKIGRNTAVAHGKIPDAVKALLD